MQELLLLTLLGALSPMPTPCTDQEQIEQVEQIEQADESTDAESDQEDAGGQDDNSQSEQGDNSQEEAEEDETEGGKKEEVSIASDDFDFSSNEFNNSKEKTGSESIFGPGTFEVTEGVQPQGDEDKTQFAL